MKSDPGRGKLIVLEGLDGSGTTTQAELLHRALNEAGQVAKLTREPTTGPVGVLIRQALRGELSAADGAPVAALDYRSMALLFAADRCDHNQRLIAPSLARGEIVISDRYTLSSLLYQSLTAPDGGDCLPWLRQINGGALRSDLTVVIDVPAAAARERRASRGEAAELYEVDELQRRLADAYARAEEFIPGERVEHVDGARDVAAVHSAVLRRVGRLLAV